MLKDHEKFISFVLLGISLFAIAVMVYLKPPSPAIKDNGAALAILNTIVGALTLAFGGAANALFKISSSEKADIAQQTATAISQGPPVQTEVTNTSSNPVPTSEAAAEELPDYAR